MKQFTYILYAIIAISCKSSVDSEKIDGTYLCNDCNETAHPVFPKEMDTLFIFKGEILSKHFGVSKYKIIHRGNSQFILFNPKHSQYLTSLEFPIYKLGKSTVISLFGNDFFYKKQGFIPSGFKNKLTVYKSKWK